jgi:two-component system, sensor histidine kinase and response regulator
MPRRTNDHPSGNVLIVDDRPENIELLRRILQADDHIVHTAMSGQAALDLTQTITPDVILLDIQMPEMDGFEVCRRLKATASTCHIPIIFISALSETDDIVHGLRLGAVDYVTKPFRIEEVRARVESQIALVRQYQEIEHLHMQERRRLEMLDRMKTEFIQMATHDLKNPLGVIQGYAYLLEDVVAVAPEHATLFTEALNGIEHSVTKMKALVTGILELAHIQSGIDLAMERVSIAKFLTQALTGFDLLAKQQGVTLTVTLPPADMEWSVDPSRMARVIDNLVSNAIKYTPAEGRVEVTVEVTAHHIIVRVADTGLGIPAKDLPRLFEAFFRVSAPSHSDITGTGLGLSVVKTIIEQHQGEIAVESELGAGSVFSICLPRPATEHTTGDPDQVEEELSVVQLAV